MGVSTDRWSAAWRATPVTSKSVGWARGSPDAVALDVSIRTLDLVPVSGDVGDWQTHQLRYGAGCGIVADSEPAAETVECDTKARLLRDYIATHCSQPGKLTVE